MAKTAEELQKEAQRLEIKEIFKEALGEYLEEQKKTRTGQQDDNGGTKRSFLGELFG